MNRHRILLMIGAMLAGASAATPQEPSPKPVPMPAPFSRGDIDEIREKVEKVKEKADALRFEYDFDIDIDTNLIRESAQLAAMMAKQAALGAFKFDAGLAFAPQIMKGRTGRHDGDDRDYERGQRALDSRNWDDALERFTQVASSGGSRADGALYWKAYA